MLKNVAFNFIDRVVLAGMRFLTALLIARMLGPEGYGIFQFAITTSIVAATFADFGFGVANNYLAARRSNIRAKLLVNSLLFVGWMGTLVGIGTFVFLSFFRIHRFSDLPDIYLVWIPLSIPIQAIHISVMGLIYGSNRFKDKLITTCIHYIFFLATIILIDILSYASVDILMPSWVGGLVASSIYCILLLGKNASDEIGWNRAIFRDQLSYGRGAFFYNLAQLLNFRLDMFLVAYFLDAEHLGWYSLATSVTEALLYLPKGLSSVILTETAMVFQKDVRFISSIYKQLILTMGVVITTVALIAPFLIPVAFSAQFSPAIVPLLILLPGTLSMGLGIVSSYYLFGMGKALWPALAALTGTFLSLTLDLLFIPLLDVMGAALGCTIAYTSFALLCLYFLRCHTKISVSLMLVPTKDDWATILRTIGVPRKQICSQTSEKDVG